MPQVKITQGLSGIKAISKYEDNPTSGFQSIAFTSNILYRVNVNLQSADAAILVFVESKSIIVRGLSGIKAMPKCEVSLTSGFQDRIYV